MEYKVGYQVFHTTRRIHKVDDGYVWFAPSGVKIQSSVPPKQSEWQDLKYLHPLWSWWQWSKAVLRAYGVTVWPVGKKPEAHRKHGGHHEDS